VDQLLLNLFAPDVLQTIGLVAVIGFIGGPKIMSWWNYERKGLDRRNGNVDTNRLLDLMEKNIEATHQFAEEIKSLNMFLKELTEETSKRANKALNQHEDILEEIAILDVPRKRRFV
jgi:hypothetical protein